MLALPVPSEGEQLSQEASSLMVHVVFDVTLNEALVAVAARLSVCVLSVSVGCWAAAS